MICASLALSAILVYYFWWAFAMHAYEYFQMDHLLGFYEILLLHMQPQCIMLRIQPKKNCWLNNSAEQDRISSIITLPTSWNSFTMGMCLLYFKMLCRIWNIVHMFLTTQQYEACILYLAPLLKADLLPNGASLQCNSGCKGGREGGSHLKHSPYGSLCTVTCKIRCVLLNMVRMLMSSHPLFWEKSPFSMVKDWNMVLFIWKVQTLFVWLIIISFCACLSMELLTKVWMEYVHIIPPIRTTKD